jgi:hypothetical protein
MTSTARVDCRGRLRIRAVKSGIDGPTIFYNASF